MDRESTQLQATQPSVTDCTLQAAVATAVFTPGSDSGPASGMPLTAASQKIGKFLVEKTLGRGGQAQALLAFDPDLHRHVVIKLYHAARSPVEQEAVLNEGRALARIRTPFVAQCFGADRHDGVPYLIVEYVPGKTLAELIRERPLPLARSLEWTAQIAQGLAAVHECGLLHRDLKPSNIIVGDDGLPRIVDFGLATPLGSDELRRVSGTPAYMSPEQARGDVQRINARTDIFGLGAVLYELLTGRPPYCGENVESVYRQARAGDVPPPSRFKDGIPAGVGDVCLRCLAKEPEHRFASAGELQAALLRLQRGRGWRGLDFVLRLGRRRFRIVIAATAAAALIGAFVLNQAPWNITATSRRVALEPAVDADSKRGFAFQGDSPAAKFGELAPANMTPAAVEAGPMMGAGLRADFPVQVEFAGEKLGANGEVVLQEGAPLQLRIETAKDCYVGLWQVDDQGTETRLFPNEADRDHFFRAGQAREIPPTLGASFSLPTPSPAQRQLHVLATTQPWDPVESSPASIREKILHDPGLPEGESPTEVSERFILLRVLPQGSR